MKFALSLLLSFFFSIDKNTCVCKFDHLFSMYDSLFFLLSFSILYLKKKKRNDVFSYIRYRIYSPCSFFTVRYHQRTSCCSLSLPLALNSNQRNVKEKEILLTFFLSGEKEKEILGIYVLRQRCVRLWVCVDKETNEQIIERKM